MKKFILIFNGFVSVFYFEFSAFATPLIDAARKGDLTKVSQLLDHPEEDVNQTDQYGNTALHEAVALGHAQVTEKLIASKADVHKANQNGDTPLIRATQYSIDINVIEQLLQAKADVNHANHYGTTALHGAALEGAVEVIEKLIRSQAHIKRTNQQGETALDWAKRRRGALAYPVSEYYDQIIDILTNPFQIWSSKTDSVALEYIVDVYQKDINTRVDNGVTVSNPPYDQVATTNLETLAAGMREISKHPRMNSMAFIKELGRIFPQKFEEFFDDDLIRTAGLCVLIDKYSQNFNPNSIPIVTASSIKHQANIIDQFKTGGNGSKIILIGTVGAAHRVPILLLKEQNYLYVYVAESTGSEDYAPSAESIAKLAASEDYPLKTLVSFRFKRQRDIQNCPTFSMIDALEMQRIGVEFIKKHPSGRHFYQEKDLARVPAAMVLGTQDMNFLDLYVREHDFASDIIKKWEFQTLLRKNLFVFESDSRDRNGDKKRREYNLYIDNQAAVYIADIAEKYVELSELGILDKYIATCESRMPKF